MTIFPLKLLFLAAMSASSTPAPTQNPQTEAAKPMCDSNGRPLAGNVRTKKAVMETECE